MKFDTLMIFFIGGDKCKYICYLFFSSFPIFGFVSLIWDTIFDMFLNDLLFYLFINMMKHKEYIHSKCQNAFLGFSSFVEEMWDSLLQFFLSYGGENAQRCIWYEISLVVYVTKVSATIICWCHRAHYSALSSFLISNSLVTWVKETWKSLGCQD